MLPENPYSVSPNLLPSPAIIDLNAADESSVVRPVRTADPVRYIRDRSADIEQIRLIPYRRFDPAAHYDRFLESDGDNGALIRVQFLDGRIFAAAVPSYEETAAKIKRSRILTEECGELIIGRRRLDRDRNKYGILPSYANYPIYYLTRDDSVLCGYCANHAGELYESPLAAMHNADDPGDYIECGQCNRIIRDGDGDDPETDGGDDPETDGDGGPETPTEETASTPEYTAAEYMAAAVALLADDPEFAALAARDRQNVPGRDRGPSLAELAAEYRSPEETAAAVAADNQTAADLLWSHMITAAGGRDSALARIDRRFVSGGRLIPPANIGGQFRYMLAAVMADGGIYMSPEEYTQLDSAAVAAAELADSRNCRVAIFAGGLWHGLIWPRSASIPAELPSYMRDGGPARDSAAAKLAELITAAGGPSALAAVAALNDPASSSPEETAGGLVWVCNICYRFNPECFNTCQCQDGDGDGDDSPEETDDPETDGDGDDPETDDPETDHYGRTHNCFECGEYMRFTGRNTAYCPECNVCPECGCPAADGFAHYGGCPVLAELADSEETDGDGDDPEYGDGPETDRQNVPGRPETADPASSSPADDIAAIFAVLAPNGTINLRYWPNRRGYLFADRIADGDILSRLGLPRQFRESEYDRVLAAASSAGYSLTVVNNPPEETAAAVAANSTEETA
jgi:hypothetical protein